VLKPGFKPNSESSMGSVLARLNLWIHQARLPEILDDVTRIAPRLPLRVPQWRFLTSSGTSVDRGYHCSMSTGGCIFQHSLYYWNCSQAATEEDWSWTSDSFLDLQWEGCWKDYGTSRWESQQFLA
jgi:hypothetical protein